MITKKEVTEAQKNWAQALIDIGKLKDDREACTQKTGRTIDLLYGYDTGNVLFKPTRAAKAQFRHTREGAISYFIGGNSNYPEDRGFALQPWSEVRFENTGYILKADTAMVMGNYFFTETGTGAVKKVEYTFGYVKTAHGSLKIILHHSSVPFTPSM